VEAQRADARAQLDSEWKTCLELVRCGEVGQGHRQASSQEEGKEAQVSIRKRVGAKGTTWQVTWREPGSREKWKSCKTLKEAQRFERDLLTAQEQGTYVDPALGKQTLAVWWKTHQRTHQGGLKPSTKDHYEGFMQRHILPHLGSRQLATIKTLDVQEWISTLKAKGVGDATVNASHRTLRAVLQKAVDLDILARNPAVGAKASRTERDEEEVRILTPSEIHAVAHAVPERYKALSMSWLGQV
jgi:hypothetical protein